jgi:hypothetical protein
MIAFDFLMHDTTVPLSWRAVPSSVHTQLPVVRTQQLVDHTPRSRGYTGVVVHLCIIVLDHACLHQANCLSLSVSSTLLDAVVNFSRWHARVAGATNSLAETFVKRHPSERSGS